MHIASTGLSVSTSLSYPHVTPLPTCHSVTNMSLSYPPVFYVTYELTCHPSDLCSHRIHGNRRSSMDTALRWRPPGGSRRERQVRATSSSLTTTIFPQKLVRLSFESELRNDEQVSAEHGFIHQTAAAAAAALLDLDAHLTRRHCIVIAWQCCERDVARDVTLMKAMPWAVAGS